MPGYGHDGKMVVAGEAQIVYGAVAQVVEGKVSQFCLLHSTAPLEFVIPCKIIDRLSLAQEYLLVSPSSPVVVVMIVRRPPLQVFHLLQLVHQEPY